MRVVVGWGGGGRCEQNPNESWHIQWKRISLRNLVAVRSRFHSLSLSGSPFLCFTGPGNTKRIDKDVCVCRVGVGGGLLETWCCTLMFEPSFSAIFCGRQVSSVKVHLHRGTATKRLRYETHCTWCTAAWRLLWRNIGISWCPWPWVS